MAASRGMLATVTDICEAFQILALQPQLQACAGICRDQGIVDIAVLGQFKAGKSSFLNALIGVEVLPVDVLPATAVVTRLGYGTTDEVHLRMLSGDIQSCTLGELPSLVTEHGNPGNVRQVGTVEVSLKALAPFGELRFVDTPGLGSVFSHNSLVSMDWLPNVGGALIAIGVNQPFGEQDLRLLLEVSRHTPEVVILLTKADLVSAEQLAAILAFTQHQVLQHGGRPLLVLPYSTRRDFNATRQRVRDHLLALAARQQDLSSKVLDHKVRAVARACRDYLLLAQRAAASAAGSRAELREKLLQEQVGILSVKGEMGVVARDLKTRARARASDHFESYRGEVTRRLRVDLQGAMADWTGTLAERRTRFEQWVEQALSEALSGVSEQGPGFLANHLLEAQASLGRQVRGFQDRLAGAIEQALGLTFEGAHFQAELAAPRHLDVRLGKVFDTRVDLLWFLIPMGLFSPLFDRHFLGLIPWEVEKNLARLANQWAEAAEACIDGLVAQALAFMRRELSTLEALTLPSTGSEKALQQALDLLEQVPDEPQ